MDGSLIPWKHGWHSDVWHRNSLGAKLGLGIIKTSAKCSESSVNPHLSLLLGLQTVLPGRDMEGKIGEKKKGIKRKYRMNSNYLMGLDDKKINSGRNREGK